MFVSVIIPTYNEEQHIGNLLADLENQSYRKFEVIVVDDNSTDRTVEICKRFGVKILFSGKHNLSFSRNLGIKESRGEILVNLDADFRINKRFLTEIVECFKKNPSLEGLKVREELFQDSLWEKIDYIRTFYRRGGITEAVRIFKRGSARYDETLSCFGEDVVINRMIKGKIEVCHKAKIFHHRFHSAKELIRSWRKYPSSIFFIKKYEGRKKLWNWVLPLFFFLLSPVVTLHKLILFKTPVALLIPLYDMLRSFSYLDGTLDYVNELLKT